jgi:hypothetical protein
MLIYFLVYSATVKMKATYSSETSVDLQRTTRIKDAADLLLTALSGYMAAETFFISLVIISL